MLTIKQAITLSAIVDKMELKITNPKATQSEIGADVIMQLACKAHKAQAEIYNFVVITKKCTLEEAGEVDIVELVKELMGTDTLNFFKSAVKLNAQE